MPIASIFDIAIAVIAIQYSNWQAVAYTGLGLQFQHTGYFTVKIIYTQRASRHCQSQFLPRLM